MIRKSWIDNGPGTNNNLRGIDPFVAVSWDEAENIVAKELNRVRKTLVILQYLVDLMVGLVLEGFIMLKANYIVF